MAKTNMNPPRNGEGDHAQHGGGVDSVRARHRTLGAPQANVRLARKLRRKMTLPEVVLWQQLRARPQGFRFRRQFPFDGYVIDFACRERRLAIEIDGEGHSMSDRPSRDARRDSALAEGGFATLRIAARDVLDNLEGVLASVLAACEGRPLHRSASPIGPPPRSGEE